MRSPRSSSAGARARVRSVRHRAGGRSSRAGVLSRRGSIAATPARWRTSTGPPSAAPTSAASCRPRARVIVTGTIYNTDRPYSTECADPGRAQIARYAWGDDYHDVIGARLDALLAWMRDAVAGAVRGARLRRHRPGAGARLRAARRHRLDRQEHLRHQPGARLVDLPRRDHLQPAARGRRAVARSVRHVHAVPRGVSDAARSSRPACSIRRAASRT